MIIDQIKKQSDLTRLVLFIDSDGGDTIETMRLIENLEKIRGKVHITTITSVALSSGALIFLAGDRRIMYSNGLLFFHGVTMEAPVWMIDRSGGLPEAQVAIAWDLQMKAEQLIFSRAKNTSIGDVKSFMRSMEGIKFLPRMALAQGLATEIRQVPVQTSFAFVQNPAT